MRGFKASGIKGEVRDKGGEMETERERERDCERRRSRTSWFTVFCVIALIGPASDKTE